MLTTPLAHVLHDFLAVQHYPENPTQHDLSSGQYGHPVRDLDTGMVVQLLGNSQRPSGVKFSVDDRTVTERDS